MRKLPALFLATALAACGISAIGCDEGGSGSAGPGVGTNHSGATTGGAGMTSTHQKRTPDTSNTGQTSGGAGSIDSGSGSRSGAGATESH